MQFISQSTQDTRALAAKLAEQARTSAGKGMQATVIALRGELGAGKTTFAQGFAAALGIIQKPKSPTFMLAKQYAIPGTLYMFWHIDCYRLTNHEDLRAMDLHTIFEDPNNIVLIEWPEHVGDVLPRDHIEVHFKHISEHKREITSSAL